MKVQLKLVEASPELLWTYGEVKNLNAPGTPTVSIAEAVFQNGTRFVAGPGLHAYRFLIKGDGTVKIQAFDVDRNVALAPAAAFDTKEAHGGHTYVFGVG